MLQNSLYIPPIAITPLQKLWRKIWVILAFKMAILIAMRFFWFSGEHQPQISPELVEQQFLLIPAGVP